MTLTPGTRIGTYEVVEPLGAGGMGEVYRARDTRLGRDVAIKVLPEDVNADAERLARFEREAHMLAALNHPHIAQIYGLEDHGGVRALVMELVEGETLDERIGARGVPLEEALVLARQIAEALEYAHERSIVHRDLKPANVKWTPDGTVKVLDFGLAKALELPGASGSARVPGLDQSPTITTPAMTRAGVILGTAAYMSPEQARGQTVDRRADIWAFGCVLFELLSGRRAFAGETVSDTLAAVLKERPPWDALPAATPPALRHLLERTLERDPRQRLRDIGEARVALQRIAAGEPGHATRPEAPMPAPSRRRERLLAAGLALAVLVAAGLGAWIALKPDGARPILRHLSVVLPEELELADGESSVVVIDPEGSTLALLVDDGERNRLVLRRLDRPSVVDVPGTVDADYPFFSPDSRWLGFVRDNAIRKVPVGSGNDAIVTSSSWGQPAWGPDDWIYFTKDYLSGLWRVPASGGNPSELTKVDSKTGELNHGFPDVLPDGSAVLFVSHRTPVSASRIEAVVVATGERRIIMENGLVPRYLRSGHLAFVRDETLMVAGFDAPTLRVTSPPAPVGERVFLDHTGFFSMFTVSAGGTLAYVPRSVLPARRDLVWLDRSGREERVVATGKTVSQPRISPDASRVAVTVSDNGLDLWLLEAGRDALTRLTSSPKSEIDAVWHPDGRRIFFTLDRPPFATQFMWLDGSEPPTTIHQPPVDATALAVSPDGRTLLVAESRPGSDRDLVALSLDKPGDVRVIRATRFRDARGTYSPDGRYLAFETDESGRPEVHLIASDGAGRAVPLSRNGGRTPRWTASGEVFFWQGRTLMAARVRTAPALVADEPRALFTADAAAGRVLTGREDVSYDVTPDGQRIVIARVPRDARPREVRIVLDWFEEVRERTGAQ